MKKEIQIGRYKSTGTCRAVLRSWARIISLAIAGAASKNNNFLNFALYSTGTGMSPAKGAGAASFLLAEVASKLCGSATLLFIG
jgi:hypothetical protein